jgi:D-3-phosphoglycerate dehydrogenase
MKKVLVTDDCHSILTDGLLKLGYVCDYLPNIAPEKAFEIIGEYSGLIINSKIMVNRAFLDRAEKLEFVGRLGSGMEIVDRVYATERNVAVASSPEGNRNAVAEHALGMLLALSNKLLKGDSEVRRNVWEREANRGFELSGRTIGIIGYGHTGRQFARKLQGMEMKVLAYDKYKSPGYALDEPWVAETTQDVIQKEADIISLHLPLTEETLYFFDKTFISATRRGVILLNTSRGKCVNTADLIHALEDGRAGGACLDVFENEKPDTFTTSEKQMYDRLHVFGNVVMSPHVAGWTVESKKKLAEILLEKITAAVRR